MTAPTFGMEYPFLLAALLILVYGNIELVRLHRSIPLFSRTERIVRHVVVSALGLACGFFCVVLFFNS